MSPPLAGHVALVTGATSGLGRHLALVLAASGATVVAVGRREERLAELTAAIGDDGGRCLPLPLDLTRAESLPAALDDVEAEVGLVDVLVNNAGIPDARRARRMPLEVVDAVLDTNVRAPWVLATEVGRRLIAAGRPGHIVNISSMGAFHYAPDDAAALYSVSKAAVNRMTEVLAVEWARHGINVNAIAPGAVETEMLDGMFARIGMDAATLAAEMPRGRLEQVADVEGTLLHLLSPAARAVTGTVIKLDDGQMPR
ncbi:SDR family oxidoreductase [Actinomycetospora sp. TBRC 11914]|nr:SDR family oxidoreductase [Actinomycetospora sp. TBRC 11914]